VLSVLCEVFPNAGLYKDALGIQAETGFSFYDSLIVASAEAGNCQRIYSEDLQSGRSCSRHANSKPVFVVTTKASHELDVHNAQRAPRMPVLVLSAWASTYLD